MEKTGTLQFQVIKSVLAQLTGKKGNLTKKKKKTPITALRALTRARPPYLSGGELPEAGETTSEENMVA